MDLVAYAPRAPTLGETVAGHAFLTFPGGKGANQALAGASVLFIGAVGDDAYAPVIRDALSRTGVDVSHLRAVPSPSGTAHIVVDDGGGNSIVVVPGANGAVTGPSQADAAAIASSSMLLLQIELPMEALIACAHGAGVPNVLTPAQVMRLPEELLSAHRAQRARGHGDHRAA